MRTIGQKYAWLIARPRPVNCNDLWAYMRSVVLDFSRLRKPTENAFIESFNGKFRTECMRLYGAKAPTVGKSLICIAVE